MEPRTPTSATRDRSVLLVGRSEPPAQPIPLTAGPLTAELVEGDLRHVRIGGVEVAQRIYVAVRDEVWNTIPGEISGLEVREEDGGFAVDFSCRHRYEDIDFAWTARIRGDRDGRISYEMDGTPGTAFRYAKIGLNLHHPLRESVGRPYRAHTPSGEIAGTLPVDIEPQLLVDGQLTALFPEYDALTIELEDGLEVRFDFEGDLFEMQDHRNWTDANLKTYGTPLSKPWPFDAQPGERLRQRIVLTPGGTLPEPAPAPAAVEVDVAGDAVGTLPPIGLALAGGPPPSSGGELELLRALRPAHLRVDLVAGDPGVEAELARGVEASRALDAPLELAVFTTEATVADVDRLAAALERDRPQVARVFVFAGGPGFSATDGATTPAALVRAARDRLGGAVGDVPFAGGTNQFFTELNRNHPQTDGVDGVVYTLNPQVHAADDLSVMENLEPQAQTVEMTRRLGGGLPVFVSPITLIGRSGPYPGGPPEPGGLPGNVDVRLASLFGAAWAAGSIAQLAPSGAAALTYFETTGQRGLLAPEDPAQLDPRFPARPGDAYPLWQVFADVAEWRGAEVLSVASAQPGTVTAVAVRDGDGVHALVANLTARRQTVSLRLPAPGPVRVRTLDAAAAATAIEAPMELRSTAAPVQADAGGRLELELEPYAVCRVDEQEGA